MSSITLTIRGVPVTFPFEPYSIQIDYMEKVIECLQNGTNAVLESPTGTGKTLSLLCASLAWLTAKKQEVKEQNLLQPVVADAAKTSVKTEMDEYSFLKDLQKGIDNKLHFEHVNRFPVPTIIYASRTHSQIAQAMQELKRTAYCNLKAVALGSREQLCIDPEVTKELNRSTMVNLCNLKVKSKNCKFYSRYQKMSEDPSLMNLNVVDIEDLVQMGVKKGFCPYYMTKELKVHADILFMPYNYLIHHGSKHFVALNLTNSVVIFDEAHNINTMCEDSASWQITSTDISLCIEEVTEIMKVLSDSRAMLVDDPASLDFTPDDLCSLKEVLLDFEKVLDNVEMSSLPLINKQGTAFDGDFIYEIFKKAGIRYENSYIIRNLIEKIVIFLTANRSGPFHRTGSGLEKFAGILTVPFAYNLPLYREKIKLCYKVHIAYEEAPKKTTNDWLSKTVAKSKLGGKVLNFWCFSSGFGMEMLMSKGMKSVILTSGTLAPLKPLISELEIDVQVELENPHIVKPNQVAVHILNKGPDGTELNSNYQNRNNPKYIASLGRTILNLSRIIPNGLLVFFPSYPVMQKCQQSWQEDGIWGMICTQKAIYVEPRQKEAFKAAMAEYYSCIKNPQLKGAIFMGVCRGKVAEGLDFADTNGRAVMITGLPFPPLMDPRVVLKRQYMDLRRTTNKETLSGSDWYALEATRAVNQAMGRVIRHRFDYGAIILLDSRFSAYRLRNQMSAWLRNRVKMVNNFGEIVRDLRQFYKSAEAELPAPLPKLRIESCLSFSEPSTSTAFTEQKKKGNFDFSTSSTCSSLNADTAAAGLVTIHSRDEGRANKRKRITIKPMDAQPSETLLTTQKKEYIIMVQRSLDSCGFKAFLDSLTFYRDTNEFDHFCGMLDNIFKGHNNVLYIIQGLEPYIRAVHKERFQEYWEKIRTYV